MPAAVADNDRLAERFLDGDDSDDDGRHDNHVGYALTDDDSLDDEHYYAAQQQSAAAAAESEAAHAEEERARAEEQAEFHSYLHSFGAQYEQHREALRAKHRAEEEDTLQPRPTISAYAAAKRRDGPVEDRLFRLQEKRQERLKQQRAAAAKAEQQRVVEEADGYVGHPRVSSHAHSIHRDGSIAETSAKWAEQHKKRMQMLHEDAMKRELAEMRPVPRIASSSVASTVDRGGLTVEEHLLLKEKERQAKLYQKVEEEIVSARKGAKPHLSKGNRAMNAAASEHRKPPLAGQKTASSGPGDVSTVSTAAPGGAAGRSASTINDTVERLYDPNHKMPAYDAEFVEKCTFQPRIYSRVDASKDEFSELPVHDRLLMRQRVRKEEQARRLADQRRAHEDSTGKPNLSRGSRRMHAERSVTRIRSASAPTAPHGEDVGASPPHDPSDAGSAARAAPSRDASMSQSQLFGGSPTDRLYNDAVRRRQERAEKLKQHRASGRRARSPKLAARTQRIASGSQPTSPHSDVCRAAGGLAPFDERQLVLEKRRESSRQKTVRAVEEKRREEYDRECTFKPQLERIRRETRGVGKAKAERIDEPHMLRRAPKPGASDDDNMAARNRRWMRERERRLEDARKAKAESELAECVFNPVVMNEVPQLDLAAQTATGAEDHIRRMREAQRERDVVAQGGHQAVERRERKAVEEARRGASTPRTTRPKEFHFQIAGNGAGGTAATPRASSGSVRRSGSVGGAGGRHALEESGRLSSLRPPVTAADLDHISSRAPTDASGYPMPPRRQQTTEYHEDPSSVDAPPSAAAAAAVPPAPAAGGGMAHFYGGGGGGYAATAAPPPRGGGFFATGDTWGDPVGRGGPARAPSADGGRRSGSARSTGDVADTAYDIGVAALGGGGSASGWTGSSGGSEAIVRHHHELFRQALSAASSSAAAGGRR